MTEKTEPKKLAEMTSAEIIELAEREETKHRERQKHLETLAGAIATTEAK